ncbi:enoyl-CoA hydratase [Halieaceae bacterium IMCC14734]|uniref:Enoyl-CoA hydratase n=1 Tax=Candidatus Litorirhabdus singularis TaxID=2518993 RepID=A0ABT3TFW3_9GAMM|nr:enoyl-CoA hydratase [Candidatus Litorirhabdus singularis]MCX2981105.1 enoyl-CoA hydratase [Candidatus Litorirhabdus singularis]
MTDPILLLEKNGAVATVTLNRPDQMNALSPELLSELCNVFKDLQTDRSILAAVLTGNGRAFCAGLDLKAMATHPGGLDAFAIHGENDVARAMADFDRPIIVGVNGVAATGGFELALMGDILICGDSARFADTHCRVGLAPGWGLSQKLSRMIGPSRAKEAHFTGNFISAQQAADWGMVSRVVADEQLGAECQKVAEDIASCVPATVKVYKKLVDDGFDSTLGAGMEMEKLVMAHANKGVSGDTIGQRRKGVQERGKSQV